MTGPFSEEEQSAIRHKYPGLELLKSGSWAGTIDLHAACEGITDSEIKDSFEVVIDIPQTYPHDMPRLREVGGRTDAIAKKHKLESTLDLHRSSNGFACVCPRQAERRRFPVGSDLLVYIEELVIPYLYGLSHYDKEGRWPWGEYSHGFLGLLEFHANDSEEKTLEAFQLLAQDCKKDKHYEFYRNQLHKPRPKRQCPCGSGKTFPECHTLAWQGLLVLREDMQRLGFNRYEIFFPKATS